MTPRSRGLAAEFTRDWRPGDCEKCGEQSDYCYCPIPSVIPDQEDDSAVE
jgi:hypothetical protein